MPEQSPKKPAVKKVVKKHPKKTSLEAINVSAAGAPATDGDSAHQVFVDSPARYDFSYF
jgi:hypothetical protein